MRIATLMDLAAANPENAADHLARVYEWKRTALETTAKGAAGVGVTLALATVIPVLVPDPDVTLTWAGFWVTWTGSALLVVVGAGVFAFARRLELEYLAAQNLLCELVEIHAFLRLNRGRLS
jgi:hypothetical protein